MLHSWRILHQLFLFTNRTINDFLHTVQETLITQIKLNQRPGRELMRERLATLGVITCHSDIIHLREGCNDNTIDSKLHIHEGELLQEVIVAIKLTTRRISHLVVDNRQTLISLIEVHALMGECNIGHLTISKTSHICTETRCREDNRNTRRRQLILRCSINERTLRLLDSDRRKVNILNLSNMNLFSCLQLSLFFLIEMEVNAHASLINQNIDNLLLELFFLFIFCLLSSFTVILNFNRSFRCFFLSSSILGNSFLRLFGRGLSRSFSGLQNIRVLSSTIQSIHDTNHLLGILRTREVNLLCNVDLSIHISQILISITHCIVRCLILKLDIFVMIQLIIINDHTKSLILLSLHHLLKFSLMLNCFLSLSFRSSNRSSYGRCRSLFLLSSFNQRCDIHRCISVNTGGGSTDIFIINFSHCAHPFLILLLDVYVVVRYITILILCDTDGKILLTIENFCRKND